MPCRIGKPRTIERSATRWGRRVGSQIMVSKFCLLVLIYISLFIASGTEAIAQSSPDIHVTVNMVQLNVAVTDKKGNYITGLQPKDFAIYEDGILEKPPPLRKGKKRPAISADLGGLGPPVDSRGHLRSRRRPSMT